MNRSLTALVLLMLLAWPGRSEEPEAGSRPLQAAQNPNIDFAAFVKLAQQLEPFRADRRVALEPFLRMAKEPGTIVLDTRSKWAYDVVHLKGAIHLNFSDFTDQKLQKTIPSENTRILIYCNNNFELPRSQKQTNVLDPAGSVNGNTDDEEEIITGTTLKQPPLALNIPTFINLWAYGYKYIYELADVVPLDSPDLPLAGTGVKRKKKQVEQRGELELR